jgi:hypothetical protein
MTFHGVKLLKAKTRKNFAHKKRINQKQGLKIMKIFRLFVAFTLICFTLSLVGYAVVPAA